MNDKNNDAYYTIARYVADVRKILFAYQKQLAQFFVKNSGKKVLTLSSHINDRLHIRFIRPKSSLAGTQTKAPIIEFVNASTIVIRLTVAYKNPFNSERAMHLTEQVGFNVTTKDGYVLKWDEPRQLPINTPAKEAALHRRIAQIESELAKLKQQTMIKKLDL